jgi:hypothetical protein
MAIEEITFPDRPRASLDGVRFGPDRAPHFAGCPVLELTQARAERDGDRLCTCSAVEIVKGVLKRVGWEVD